MGMTLDEYVTWAAGVGVGRRAGVPEGHTLLEDALGFAGEVGEVAGVLTRWLRDGDRRRDDLTDELGDVAYYWARLCVVTEVAPSTLLARSRAHVDWRRAGRPAGGPTPGAAAMTLEEYAARVLETGGAGLTDRPDDQSLLDVGLALVEDAGEVVECLRRLAREGDGQRERLTGELGDVCATGRACVSPAASRPPRCWCEAGKRTRAGWQANAMPVRTPCRLHRQPWL